MTPTKTSRPRGRPRGFDPDAAIATAQHLFHARGFDRVSVSDVTDAIGINPPSFYAAFGSKAGLYAQILDRYQHNGALDLDAHLRPDRPVGQALAGLLEEAARQYVADPVATGCLVVEGTRSADDEAREAACVFQRQALEAIHGYIAARHPGEAQALTDFVGITMTGLSAVARRGQGLDRLLSTARLAGLAIAQVLPE
ncbi:TetR family transcriptional regulator [Hoeflea marina]|uniref:TetR family transcriptional regulator n=1 Tax=Hoeflea marina TaxID=274592 RepID=A0A317PT33_9HYPH|nr:TetR/AcrR family transcriptional regulator [Hoeflea marina]PWW03794.1 TetR family transcriptional regulator [Hoeflea marina]